MSKSWYQLALGQHFYRLTAGPASGTLMAATIPPSLWMSMMPGLEGFWGQNSWCFPHRIILELNMSYR